MEGQSNATYALHKAHECNGCNHGAEQPERGPENTPNTVTLLPDLGGASFTSGNDAKDPEIPLNILSSSGQAQHAHPHSIAVPSRCCGSDHGTHGRDSHGGHTHSHDFAAVSPDLGLHGRDIEHDAALERIVVLVAGVHCTSCADGLQRALRNVPGVFHPHVNFAQGRVDFQLDRSLNTPGEVAQFIRAHSRSYSAVVAGDQNHYIDILTPPSLVRSVEEQNIPGLLEISALDKSSARVSYDPTTIGARALLERLREFSQALELAPLEADPAVAYGKQCRKKDFTLLCLAALLALPVAILNLGRVPIDGKIKAMASLILATLVQLIAVDEFYKPALVLLVRYGTFEMDMLVTVSITAAYVYSVTASGFLMAGKPLEEKPFFETSALLITFVLLGRFIATYARTYAVGKVSFRALQPTKAIIIENDRDRQIDSRLLQFGDKFKVLPGTKIPTDGTVVVGSGEVDESMLTGEGLPVRKTPGSLVSAGTINGTATLEVQILRLPGKNTVTDIASQVEEASKFKPRVQEIADRVAKYIVTAVVILAVIVFMAWLLVELKGRHHGMGKSVARAITYAVAVLAVSCPCALGLAVPIVIVVAGGLAAKEGVVIKASESTVCARKVTDVVFDKTGTITNPDLEVEEDHAFSYNKEAVWPIAKALVQNNKHPVSVAVNRFLDGLGVEAADVTDAHVHPGQGVVASLQGAVVKAGSPQWTLSDFEPDIKAFVDDGCTILSVTRDDIPVVCFALRSRLQPDTAEVVRDLTRRGITVHLVSGDQDVAVWNAAKEAGICDTNVRSRRSLQDKVDYVAWLQSDDKVVLFCGDGANDAAAVSRADVGVHVGDSLSSSDITCDAANVVLLNGLKGIPYLLDVSGSAYRRIMFNFAWALLYNTVAIMLAAGVFVKAGGEKARIPPAFAGLGELVSVLPVIVAGGTMFFSRSVRRAWLPWSR